MGGDRQQAAREPWLPDLCRLPRLAAMLGLSELVVVIVALVPDGSPAWSLGRFLSVSGYALWLGLAVTVLLCVSRRELSRFSKRTGAVLAVALATVVAGLAAAIVHGLFVSVGSEAADWAWPSMARFVSGSAGVVGLITALALRYFYVTDRWQAQVSAIARAEADALQARIRPHFLFNSMNMIAGLLPRDPQLAERAVLDLSDLFRASLARPGSLVTWGEELELSRRYLSIEQYRLGNRLRVDWQVEGVPEDLPIPQLTLQPMLENALIHGIQPRIEGGVVGVAAHYADGVFHLEVSNPYDETAQAPPSRGTRQGLRNIDARLTALFGSAASLSVERREGRHYTCLRYPCARQKQEARSI